MDRRPALFFVLESRNLPKQVRLIRSMPPGIFTCRQALVRWCRRLVRAPEDTRDGTTRVSGRPGIRAPHCVTCLRFDRARDRLPGRPKLSDGPVGDVASLHIAGPLGGIRRRWPGLPDR